MKHNTRSPRVTVRRQPDRGRYDSSSINAILDAGLVCSVGFVEGGRPVVIPMLYARQGAVVYLHGSTASRLTKKLAAGVDACLCVTLIDGLVLARSVFNTSMNYRSVVLFGRAAAIEDPAEKLRALRLFSEHMMAGRWDDARQPSESELAATRVLRFEIEDGSAKIRTGPPKDGEEDLALPVWAGVLPLALCRGTVESATPDKPVPPYVQADDRFPSYS
jgi:nitroimidazol reductase NimA-like FMN-containing flavoprotein (pyridoxamine 5'-phosphate oxidase superfamily)